MSISKENNKPAVHQEAGKKKKHGIITYPDRINDYEFKNTIGEGAFSIVKLVYNKKYDKHYACKIVPIHMLEERDLYQRFDLEIRISQIMRHPGVAAVTDLLKDENNFYVFMEYYPNGNLLNYIVKKTRLDEEEAKGLIYQIFDALEYVHVRKVSHRDLKPENIMIDNHGRLRISDFGLSRFVGEDNLVKTPCGSPCYVSPECISGHNYDGLISDIWSCGVILYAMVTGMLPWTKKKMSDLFHQIRHGEFRIPSYVSKQCSSLIQMLLTVDPERRITLENAKQHAWFQTKIDPFSTIDYKNYSIPLDTLKPTEKVNDKESNFAIPDLSTRRVDFYLRPDIDFSIDSMKDNYNLTDGSSPDFCFEDIAKFLNNSSFRRREKNGNVNLSIHSSSGQLIIKDKLYTNNTPNSILAYNNEDNQEDNDEIQDDENDNAPQFPKRNLPKMELPNRKSATFPSHF